MAIDDVCLFVVDGDGDDNDVCVCVYIKICFVRRFDGCFAFPMNNIWHDGVERKERKKYTDLVVLLSLLLLLQIKHSLIFQRMIWSSRRQRRTKPKKSRLENTSKTSLRGGKMPSTIQTSSASKSLVDSPQLLAFSYQLVLVGAPRWNASRKRKR